MDHDDRRGGIAGTEIDHVQGRPVDIDHLSPRGVGALHDHHPGLRDQSEHDQGRHNHDRYRLQQLDHL